MTKSTHDSQMENLQVEFDANEKAKVAKMIEQVKKSIKEKTMELNALQLLLRTIEGNYNV